MKKNFALTTFVTICMIVTLIMGISTPLGASAAPLAQDVTPTITTDKADYTPGEVVVINGKGFEPGSYQNGLTTGTIIINKVTDLADDVFDYTVTGSDLMNFSITTSNYAGSKTFSNVTAGAKTVTESAPPTGWDFTSLVCSDPDNGTTISGQTANIDLDAGETITCTFTNSVQVGSITVKKYTIGGYGTFWFTTNYLKAQPIILTTSGDNNPASSATTNYLTPGQYTVEELGPIPGWEFGFVSCTDDDWPDDKPGDQTATIVLDPSENVVCTFTNELKPQVKVVKDLYPSDDNGLFNLAIDGTDYVTDGGDGTDSGFQQFSVSDTPTVSESAGTDTNLSDYESSISCSNGQSADPATSLQLNALTAGDKVICTITNTKRATKSGYKWEDRFEPYGEWDQANEPALPGWTIELWDVTSGTPVFVASANTNGSGYYEFSNIDPGKTYAVCDLLSFSHVQTFPMASTIPPAGEVIFACSAELGPQYGPYGYQFTAASGDEHMMNNFGTREPPGCTYTEGYWKSHSIYGPARKLDDGWYTTFGPYPPGVDGPDALLFDSGFTWYEVFMSPAKAGNIWHILAHQWMAAYLNYYNGAGDGGVDVVQWLADSAAILDAYDDEGSGNPLIPKGSADRNFAIELADWLEKYNNGYWGPGFCSE